MTTTRTQAPAQTRKAALESEYAPLYAAAGLTDLAVESVRNLVLATQEKAGKQFTEWQGSFAELQSKGTEQAKHAGEFVRALPDQVKALPEQLKHLPETTKAWIEELDQQRKEFLAEATSTYGDLAGRGKKVIDDSVIAVRKTGADVQADVAEKVDEVREDVAATIDPAMAEAAREAESARRSAAAKKAAATRKANKAAAAKKAAAKAETSADTETAA